MIRVVVGSALVVLPIVFNLCFMLLARTFNYPDILREPTAHVLSRFRSGGPSLVLTWWAFMLTALLFAPVAFAAPWLLPSASIPASSFVGSLGLLAGLVQALGLSRWPFVVPYLVQQSEDADDLRRVVVDVQFQTLNRLLGVAIGEHLGYLLTGVWTLALGVIMIPVSGAGVVIGTVGILIGALLIICSWEFLGPFALKPWTVASRLTPIAYIMWSVWLITVGVTLLIG